MESTKVFSEKVSYDRYEKMIFECDAKDITFSEFIERKVASAGALKTTFAKNK
jgi:hypothetical protein